jgi:hypothetical protein
VLCKIFVPTLLLLAAEDGTIDCSKNKKWKKKKAQDGLDFECHLQSAANKVVFLVHWFFFIFTKKRS